MFITQLYFTTKCDSKKNKQKTELIVSIIVLATCKWLLALCCLINLNLNLK